MIFRFAALCIGRAALATQIIDAQKTGVQAFRAGYASVVRIDYVSRGDVYNAKGDRDRVVTFV